jgi:hypothetical protein
MPLRTKAGTILTILSAVSITWVTETACSSALAAEPNPTPDPSDLSCAVPPLPHGVAGSSTTKLSGPAVSALTGGAARHGFSLDGGDLVVKPPRRAEEPLLSANQAICGAMNSTGGLSAVVTQGVAAGYGEVSVARKFFPAITSFPYKGYVAAQNPTVSTFHDRLAWVVVVHTDPVFASMCAIMRKPVHFAPRASDHGYEVFLIDARTGTDALVYTEGRPGGCKPGEREPPSVGVAEESVSVPWTLVSRDPDGYSGTIAATVFPCDKFPSVVLVDRAGPNVVVPVTRPFGPPCGPPEEVPISLRAAEVTLDLPAVIGHDPVGLTNLLSLPVSSPPGTSPPTTTSTTAAPLVNVDESSNGETLELTVGEVVTIPPLPGTLAGLPVSSDPAVLGPLTSSPQPIVAELRAWKAGTAVITVPQSACFHPVSDQPPCNGPFAVYVVVRSR